MPPRVFFSWIWISVIIVAKVIKNNSGIIRPSKIIGTSHNTVNIILISAVTYIYFLVPLKSLRRPTSIPASQAGELKEIRKFFSEK
jgi:hypothetical protein